MIYVHRDWDNVPNEIKAALKSAASALDAIVDIEERKAYINENRDKWSTVRGFLSRMSHDKCWYSEAIEAVSRYQVDHFRPHGRVKQAEKSFCEGYSWLAFNIDNFRLVGVLCNTVNKEYSDESVGKGDWFPLANPATRAYLQNRDTSNETPIILDPADPEDPYKLWFEESGDVKPNDELPPDQKKAIEEAIRCLGLRQTRLNSRRRSKMRCALRAVNRYKEVDRVPKGRRTPRDVKILQEARGELLAMSAPTGEFAAAVRCLLVANGLRHLVQMDELKPLRLAQEDM